MSLSVSPQGQDKYSPCALCSASHTGHYIYPILGFSFLFQEFLVPPKKNSVIASSFVEFIEFFGQRQPVWRESQTPDVAAHCNDFILFCSVVAALLSRNNLLFSFLSSGSVIFRQRQKSGFRVLEVVLASHPTLFPKLLASENSFKPIFLSRYTE